MTEPPTTRVPTNRETWLQRPKRVRKDFSVAGFKDSLITNSLVGRAKGQISIKFREGSGVRVRGGRWFIESKRTSRSNRWTTTSAARGLERVQTVLRAVPRHAILRTAPFAVSYHDAVEKLGEERTGFDIPNMNLWYRLFVDGLNDSETLHLVRGLNELPIVELAYPSMVPVIEGRGPARTASRWPTPALQRVTEAGAPLPEVSPRRSWSTNPWTPPPPPGPMPAVPDFTSSEVYLSSRPRGLNLDYLQSRYYSAKGSLAAFADVEYAWNHRHADLPDEWKWLNTSSPLFLGRPPAAGQPLYHGTSVLGVVMAQEPSFWSSGLRGTTGMAPNLRSVFLSTVRQQGQPSDDIPGAIIAADAALVAADPVTSARGAVLLIEVGMQIDLNHNGKFDDDETVAIQADPASFHAISSAVYVHGIHVVEPSGNGGVDLVDALGDSFDPWSDDYYRDSGAIMVGAAFVDEPHRASYSNHGWIVDVNAGVEKPNPNPHGESLGAVVTVDHPDRGSLSCDLYGDVNHPNTCYTGAFNGTSAAGAIVAGALAAFTSVSRGYYGADLKPLELRDMLRLTGNPGIGPHGGWFTEKVGVRPDLKPLTDYLHNRHLQTGSTDLDGDGRADFITWTPPGPDADSYAQGQWAYRYASHPQDLYQGPTMGQQGDIPVPGNYRWQDSTDTQQHPKAELMMFRCGQGLEFGDQRCSWDEPAPGQGWIHRGNLGRKGDIPVPLDWDGDGLLNLAVYRPVGNVLRFLDWWSGNVVGGVWKIWDISRLWWLPGSPQIWYVRTIHWGFPESTPLAADFNGDEHDDLALYDRLGTWHVLLYPFNVATNSHTFANYQICTGGDVPMVRNRGSEGNPPWGIACYRHRYHSANYGFFDFDANTLVSDFPASSNFVGPGTVVRMARLSPHAPAQLVVFDPSTRKFARSGYTTGTTGDTNAYAMVR